MKCVGVKWHSTSINGEPKHCKSPYLCWWVCWFRFLVYVGVRFRRGRSFAWDSIGISIKKKAESRGLCWSTASEIWSALEFMSWRRIQRLRASGFAHNSFSWNDSFYRNRIFIDNPHLCWDVVHSSLSPRLSCRDKVTPFALILPLFLPSFLAAIFCNSFHFCS